MDGLQKVLNSIFFIEKKAQEMVEDAQRECESIFEDANKERETIKQNIVKRQNARLEKIKAYEEDHASAKRDKITAQSRRELEKINAIYEKNKDFWIESIFEKVTGR